VIYNTLFTGKFLVHEPSMTSTNAFAQKLISKTKPIDGTVIITDEQSQGKGQGVNVWQSEQGKNITCSIIYDTSFLEVRSQYFLNMAVAVAVGESLGNYMDVTKIRIKWPNDILFADRKIGGILIENSVQGRYLRHSIIGIGLNINQAGFSDLPHATSVLMETGKSVDLDKVLNSLCESMEHLFLKLKGGQSDQIFSCYNSLLFKRNDRVELEKSSERFQSIIQGVDSEGRLVTEENGTNKVYRFGEVKWLYG